MARSAEILFTIIYDIIAEIKQIIGYSDVMDLERTKDFALHRSAMSWPIQLAS